ncbi:MAG: aspartate aminotransferase family protein, partial [Acutalibacteraceae bacterium]
MMTDKEIKETDQKYIMNTYKRYDVSLVKGKGVYGYDALGKRYIDTASGIGVNSLGYCSKGWTEAVKNQLDNIQHISNYYYSEPTSILAKTLCENTGMAKVFFGNSGAEANECAIKIARKYSFDKYGKERNEIITLNNSFHGRTITTLSATGQEVFHNYFFPFTEGFKYAQPNDINSVREAVSSKTSAIMLECVQGEGGVNILTKDFVKEVYDLCKEKDILLIVDEVQTGVGRTGKLFSYMHYSVSPDIITCAKGLGGGLPIGACLCNEKLGSVLVSSTHGTTFGGNPVVASGANYVLSVVNKEDFLRDVCDKGDFLKQELLKIDGVKSVKNLGLMVGIELKKDNALEIAEKCVKNGLLIITAKNLLRMLPPLIITKEEIKEAVA